MRGPEYRITALDGNVRTKIHWSFIAISCAPNFVYPYSHFHRRHLFLKLFSTFAVVLQSQSNFLYLSPHFLISKTFSYLALVLHVITNPDV